MKKFKNCLRIQIVPNHYEDERISSVLEFCKKYEFQDVMLFINAEDYFHGHITKEEAAPWVETIKKAKRILNDNGISVSLNPWIEMGHNDRGRRLKKGQNFNNMVDYEGKKLDVVACPLCGEWKKYLFEYYEYLIKEIQPDVIWVEDDFRLHNHGDLKYGGCFCPLHMEEFNKEAGTNYSREEFVEGLFGEKADKKIRETWLNVNRRIMAELAKEIGDKVRSLGYNTKIGLMSSGVNSHCLEGRDWTAITDGFMQGQDKIHRLHLPSYYERNAKEYMFDVEFSPMANREFIPRDCKIYPELENGYFSTFDKEPEYLGFQIESALPMCLSGMTYDIFDFAGNGCINDYKYGEAVSERMSYLNGVLNLNIEYDDLCGVYFPIDEMTVKNIRKPIKVFEDLRPKEFEFKAYTESFGISCRFSKNKRFKDKIVALAEGSMNNFTDEELIELFNDNFVMLDGTAALSLFKRGLGYLAGIECAKLIPHDTSAHSYEESVNEIRSIKGRRASTYLLMGDLTKIDYRDGAEVLTKIYIYDGEFYSNGIVKFGNVLISPWDYVNNGIIYYELFNPVRVENIKNVLRAQNRQLVMTDYYGVSAYRYAGKSEDKIILINPTVHSLDEITMYFVGITPKQIFAVSREDGELREVEFTTDGDKVVIKRPLNRLSSATLVVKK